MVLNLYLKVFRCLAKFTAVVRSTSTSTKFRSRSTVLLNLVRDIFMAVAGIYCMVRCTMPTRMVLCILFFKKMQLRSTCRHFLTSRCILYDRVDLRTGIKFSMHGIACMPAPAVIEATVGRAGRMIDVIAAPPSPASTPRPGDMAVGGGDE